LEGVKSDKILVYCETKHQCIHVSPLKSVLLRVLLLRDGQVKQHERKIKQVSKRGLHIQASEISASEIISGTKNIPGQRTEIEESQPQEAEISILNARCVARLGYNIRTYVLILQ